METIKLVEEERPHCLIKAQGNDVSSLTAWGKTKSITMSVVEKGFISYLGGQFPKGVITWLQRHTQTTGIQENLNNDVVQI